MTDPKHLNTINNIKVPLLWIMKGSYFGPQPQVNMHARSKNTFIVL